MNTATQPSRGQLLLDRGASLPLILPATLLVLVFLVGPFYYMAYTAMTDLSFANPDQKGAFIGFDNFRRLVRDDAIFWDSFWLTIRFVVVAVAIEFLLGFALAWLIWRYIERQRLLTTLASRPNDAGAGRRRPHLAPALAGRLRHGHPLSAAVGLLSPASAVFSSPGLVMPTIIAIDVWQWTPFVTLIILAGLMSLPRSPFEAATMDGAGPWRQFVDILLPLLRPIIALVLLLRGIDAFKEFDKVYIMTGGGPGTVSELLSIYAYRVNFKTWNLGYGAAVSFMVYLVVLILCSVFYKAVYWKSADSRGVGDGQTLRKSSRSAILACVLVIALTPYVWMLLTSFKGRLDILSPQPTWFFTPTLANYPAVFIDKDYLPLVYNSLDHRPRHDSTVDLDRRTGGLCLRALGLPWQGGPVLLLPDDSHGAADLDRRAALPILHHTWPDGHDLRRGHRSHELQPFAGGLDDARLLRRNPKGDRRSRNDGRALGAWRLRPRHRPAWRHPGSRPLRFSASSCRGTSFSTPSSSWHSRAGR